MKRSARQMIKHAGREVLCTALAAVMCVTLLPAQAMAAGGNKYVSELSMAYGSNAKADLESAGYTVIDQDLNVGTGRQDVYMGYKTTTDAADAITDVAVMHMNGGYSISDYEEMLNNRRDSIEQNIQSIWNAVKELRAAKEKGAKGIDSVIESMNMFWEDDTDQGMGDFMLKCTSKELAEVMLQSNETASTALQQLLSQGIATNWASKLADVDPDGDYEDANADDAADILRAQLASIRKQVVAFEKQGVTEETLQEMEDAVAEDATATTEYIETCMDDAAYAALENTEYGDGTLLDLVKTKPANLTADMCLPIAAQMTKGQRELLGVVGFSQLLMSSLSCNSSATEEAMEQLQDAADLAFETAAESEEAMEGLSEGQAEAIEAKHVSMYEGVNRELFTGSVALTNDALRKQASTGDTSMFFNNTASKVLYGVAAAVAVAGLTTFAIWAVRALKFSKWTKVHTYFVESYQTWTEMYKSSQELLGWCKGQAAANSSTFGLAAGILAGIACILAGIAMGIDLYNYYHPDYKEIPDMMVNQVDETDDSGTLTSCYVHYSVVRLATANDKGDYEAADTNGFKGLQWNAVYTTKDASAGDPILADSLAAQVGSSTAAGTDAVGFHAFGDETAAYDLNAHSYKNDKGGVYLFFQRDAGAFATGSAFGSGYLFLSAGVGLLAGVAITLAATAATRRRRSTATA